MTTEPHEPTHFTVSDLVVAQQNLTVLILEFLIQSGVLKRDELCDHLIGWQTFHEEVAGKSSGGDARIAKASSLALSGALSLLAGSPARAN